MLAVHLFLVFACGPKKTESPESSFSEAQLLFQRGDLIHAEEKASLGTKQWQNSPEWSWRFRILKAEILVWRGLSKDSLEEIKDIPPAQLPTDIVVRWRTTRALAFCLLRQYDDADRLFLEAHSLSSSNRSDLLAEILAGQGLAALFRNNYDQAETLLGESTKIARQSNNHFIEASSLGNLGLASLRRGRYDQAIDWYEAALVPSTALGNKTSIEKVNGSLGWCYYKMGDFEKALGLYAEAVKVAAEMGVLKDQQIWLSNIGLIYMKQRDYKQAQSYYAQSLSVAERLDSKPAAATVLTNLALSEIQAQQFQQAEEHNAKALEIKHSLNDRPAELYSILNQAQLEASQAKVPDAKQHFNEVITESDDVSLRWEAQVELAKLYLSEKQTHTAETQFRKALATIDDARSSLSKEEYRLSFLNTATAFYDDYIDFLISRGRVDDALAVAEHSRARTLAEGLGIKPAALGSKTARPTEVAGVQNAVILAYWLKPERSYLWAITPTKVSVFPLPSDTEINATVETYRKALIGPRDPLESANAPDRSYRDPGGASAKSDPSKVARDRCRRWLASRAQFRNASCSRAKNSLLDRRRNYQQHEFIGFARISAGESHARYEAKPALDRESRALFRSVSSACTSQRRNSRGQYPFRPRPDGGHRRREGHLPWRTPPVNRASSRIYTSLPTEPQVVRARSIRRWCCHRWEIRTNCMRGTSWKNRCALTWSPSRHATDRVAVLIPERAS